MVKRMLRVLLVLALAISFSTLTFSQEQKKEEMKKDEMKKEEPKMEMTKGEKAMGPLKSLSCDETCGFMVRSRDEKEVMTAGKSHMKKIHHKEVTDKQMKEMIKTESAEMMHK